ncbi:MAG TPA: FAD-dependent oxidoreductase [Candidatus Limnocylindrales bacterium]|nr:FAD-dependent oxidoreductase [Candidatus Limnocylindrales bacterium]
MRTEEVHSVILGAGPAGLSAAYTLAKAGCAPVVLEKSKFAGGLMRSIKRGDFVVDIGRKELYNRLPKVDGFWDELLGADYCAYPHRGGVLFDGHIIEISSSFRGFRRGMPLSMLMGCTWDLLSARARYSGQPHNLEEYFYQRRGRRLSQVISQGFQEKLAGVKWADVPLPEHYEDSEDSSMFSTIKALMTRALAKKEVNTAQGLWRHPAKGTGQICEALEQGIVKYGGRIHFEANVLEMNASSGFIDGVKAEVAGETFCYKPKYVVSSIPSHFLLKLLLKDRFDALDGSLKAPPSSKKTIVLVYVFLDEEPHFPHGWLNVTCPKTRIGRITNYSGINSRMVPTGKTCLCCEFYCYAGDSLLELDNKAFAQLALQECRKYGLANPDKCSDELVIRLPGADASQNRHNWMSNMRQGLLDELSRFKNLYYVSRTDLDIATLAGVESAEAILSGDRATFDRHIDPNELDIQSTKKTFEFRNPAEQGI